MPKRTCVFVDGENFRNVVCDLFSDFDRRDYLPKKARWAEFFDWLVLAAHADANRMRTYWYVIEFIDFFPYKFPDPDREPEILKNLLSKHPPLSEQLSRLSGSALAAAMKEAVDDLTKKRARMKSRFDGWQTLQDAIALRHRSIEFRRAGAILYNLFEGSLGEEKAVDVRLASDLITLREIYDLAVVVSGDQDYVPAVQVAKDSGKHVVSVVFRTRGGKLLPGGARRLNQAADWSLEVSFDVFRKYLELDAVPAAAPPEPTEPPEPLEPPEAS